MILEACRTGCHTILQTGGFPVQVAQVVTSPLASFEYRYLPCSFLFPSPGFWWPTFWSLVSGFGPFLEIYQQAWPDTPPVHSNWRLRTGERIGCTSHWERSRQTSVGTACFRPYYDVLYVSSHLTCCSLVLSPVAEVDYSIQSLCSLSNWFQPLLPFLIPILGLLVGFGAHRFSQPNK